MKNVLELNADNWETEVLQHNALVVVDFWHERCLWCLQLNSIFDDVSEKYNKVKFAKLNILASSNNRQIAVKYGIMGTPTLVFFCKGRPVEVTTGFKPKEQLEELVDNVIEKYQECVEKSTEFKP